jgi:hypothetical protein
MEEQRREKGHRMFYGAIDLHSNNKTVGIINDRGEKLFKRALPNELETVIKVLDPFRVEMKGIVVESTYNWYWLVDGLKLEPRASGVSRPREP